jgi:hypothetical protein
MASFQLNITQRWLIKGRGFIVNGRATTAGGRDLLKAYSGIVVQKMRTEKI